MIEKEDVSEWKTRWAGKYDKHRHYTAVNGFSRVGFQYQLNKKLIKQTLLVKHNYWETPLKIAKLQIFTKNEKLKC